VYTIPALFVAYLGHFRKFRSILFIKSRSVRDDAQHRHYFSPEMIDLGHKTSCFDLVEKWVVRFDASVMPLAPAKNEPVCDCKVPALDTLQTIKQGLTGLSWHMPHSLSVRRAFLVVGHIFCVPSVVPRAMVTVWSIWRLSALRSLKMVSSRSSYKMWLCIARFGDSTARNFKDFIAISSEQYIQPKDAGKLDREVVKPVPSKTRKFGEFGALSFQLEVYERVHDEAEPPIQKSSILSMN
jgi:hypothetical protein